MLQSVENIVNNSNDDMFRKFDQTVVLCVTDKECTRVKQRYKTKSSYTIAKFQGYSTLKNEGPSHLSKLDILSHKVCDGVCANIRQNHLKIIQNAYDSDLNHVLIIESDVNFSQNKLSPDVFEWLRSNSDMYDVCFMGCAIWPFRPCSKIRQNVYLVSRAMGTFCYVVTRRGMCKLLKLATSNHHIDYLISSTQDICKVAVYPHVAYQEKPPALYERAVCDVPLLKNLSFRSTCDILFISSAHVTQVLMIVLLFLLLLQLCQK